MRRVAREMRVVMAICNANTFPINLQFANFKAARDSVGETRWAVRRSTGRI